MSFEAHDYPAYQLFTRRCYGTPRNQRQYVWNRRNWQELFDDVILVATQKEPTHFIGSIVLYREKDRKNGVSYFTIVDGQQRIISLTIFLASIAFWLRCHEADNEFHGTRQYLFTRDDSNNESIVIKSEQYLSLERIVCGIFSAPVNKIQNYDIAALVKRYASNPKDKNLVSAFSFFISNIYDEMQHSKLSPTQFLLALRSAITDKLLYVDIMASSEEDACTIFEILNARGSALEGHELYLMYKGVVSINDWQIYILKSKAELLDSVGRLRMLIIWLSVVMIAICLLIVLFLSRQMTSSLQRLALQMNRMRNGELEARYYYPYKDEIGSLAKSFNYMADQVEQSMKKQEEYIAVLKEERDFVEQAQKQKRKAELQALQAQINPHFLYNTLNTITWLASEQGMNEVRILSNALGKFFRIGLSRGAEVIPVKDELEHVKSYLTIQEIRYAEVMEYTLDVPEELWPCTILKLVLQPLVENSIYHGIKEKNGKGRIVLRAREEQSPDGSPQILFTVEDTGVGMSRDKVESINRALEIGTTEHSDGYGIFNVNERIKLYYGEGYGLHYESCEGEWTRATLTIPKCMQEKDKCTEY